MKFDNWKFSMHLRKKRYDEGLNIRQASENIGISYSTLSRLENCKEPDLDTYYKCCLWLNETMDSFFN